MLHEPGEVRMSHWIV